MGKKKLFFAKNTATSSESWRRGWRSVVIEYPTLLQFNDKTARLILLHFDEIQTNLASWHPAIVDKLWLQKLFLKNDQKNFCQKWMPGFRCPTPTEAHKMVARLTRSRAKACNISMASSQSNGNFVVNPSRHPVSPGPISTAQSEKRNQLVER